MAFSKYIVSALAVATVALAQCPTTSPFTIQNSGDAAQLAGCTTFKGDIIIASQTSGSIALDGVQQVTGDISCENAGQLTAITSDQLTTIGGQFSLTNLTILSTLQFSSLTAVDTIVWVGLPALQSLNFAQGIQTATNVGISNTQLNSLSGIELMTVSQMDINNNNYLNTVNVNNIHNVTQSLSFAANSKDLTISFPNLEFAGNLTFRNVSAVSMPSLASVNGSLGFYSNTIQSFSAPNLTQTQSGAVVFTDNSQLSNISMPALKQVGAGFQIANNTALKVINGFPDLAVIVGALDFSGEFTNVSLPALKDVRGGFNMQTTATFDCSQWQADQGNSIIKGTFTCAGKQSSPGSAGSTPTGSGSSSTSTHTGAASPLNVNSQAVMGVGSLIAGLFFL